MRPAIRPSLLVLVALAIVHPLAADPSTGEEATGRRLARAARAPEALGPGGLLVEAESFAGPWREQTNYPGYSGTGFRVSNAEGTATTVLTTTIRLGEAGEYAVWARGLVTPGSDRSFSVEVGGTRLPPTHRSGGASGFRWDRCGTVRLAAGEATITIRDEGPGYECPDVIYLTRDVAAAPPESVGSPELPGASPRSTSENLARLIALHDEDDRRRRASVTAPESWINRRGPLSAAVKHALGLDPEPPRGPLGSRTVEVLERDGYAIEKLVFESRPGMPVPANLYLPRKKDGPLPAVLCPVGHWGLSKAEPVVQARCVGLARLGFVALTYDALGQGERAVEGNEHGHAYLAGLVGESNMTYMVWDSVRALDYLLGRPEVDASRVGCTGCSGGGLNTMYLSAVEPRLAAAVPVGYVCTFASFLGTGIVHCPCSHVPGMARLADMDEICALFAPRPLLVVGGRKDPMFTESGMTAAVEGARRLYVLGGARQGPRLFFDDCGHDYSRPMREQMYGFFLQELCGKGGGEPVVEPLEGWQAEKPATLSCFPEGRVPATALTYRRAVLERLAANGGKDPREVLAIIRGILSGRDRQTILRREVAEAPELAPAKAEVAIDADGFRHRILRLSSGKAAGPSVLLLDDPGLTADTPRFLRALVDAGAREVVALEPALWSETGVEAQLAATNGLLTGRPLAALWVRAALSAGPERALIVARGPASSAVALLAFVGEGTFEGLLAVAGPASWTDLVHPGTARPGTLLPGVGLAGDVADLLRASAPRPVLWSGSTLRAELPSSVKVVEERADPLTWLRHAAER